MAHLHGSGRDAAGRYRQGRDDGALLQRRRNEKALGAMERERREERKKEQRAGSEVEIKAVSREHNPNTNGGGTWN